MNFREVRRQIERCVYKLSSDFSLTPELILTEHDLRCRLDQHLRCLARKRRPIPSRVRHLSNNRIHHDLPWFDEDWKLRIRPDITILEPEHLTIRNGHYTSIMDPFSGCGRSYRRTVPLPSKGFEFDGKAITIELKFARNGITRTIARLIKEDFEKMQRIFRIRDDRGDGESVFGYLIIFNRLEQPPWQTPLAKFLRENESGPRHKIIYKMWQPSSKGCSRRLNGSKS
jgi:hypothetical protein